MKMLIERGANVNVVLQKRKMTPLHSIVIMESADLFKFFWTEDDTLGNFYFVRLLHTNFGCNKMSVN